MEISIKGFNNGDWIPAEFAFCKPDKKEKIALSENKNPHVHWRNLPKLTRSLALICHDPDVPESPDMVNKEQILIKSSSPRCDFYHWCVANIPPETCCIHTGSHSTGITPHGKPAIKEANGLRTGLNSYTDWFSKDPDMCGNYFGYDGPCPPWNDERLHHYVFTVYALDIKECNLPGNFTGPDLKNEIQNHILDSASWIGIYSLNPDLYSK
ncbi:MAG: YbhB/YbcL family Raf kinase inhibitor-like protein [Proteobacteria bacterium]|nr:YbhB/YbcL family Raf kinase inhibitor-like protein [Pseudomonadota bacterium]MDE3208591.1 YbhB/YbcL family Raf kinase inhibitor-like protein [Pseudomonadota bacterium]